MTPAPPAIEPAADVLLTLPKSTESAPPALMLADTPPIASTELTIVEPLAMTRRVCRG
ncbi:hypothetical protein GGD57_002867 [Rhizobium esperanzae]|uniref:Uncharacterized protein n=1 Tax=Rhizobium esperanzae TaxID=1967781 RepID=A0A7W6R423_9HYPH|nr:hypothetical protein [Rhizobium esperanzae]